MPLHDDEIKRFEALRAAFKKDRVTFVEGLLDAGDGDPVRSTFLCIQLGEDADSVYLYPLAIMFDKGDEVLATTMSGKHFVQANAQDVDLN